MALVLGDRVKETTTTTGTGTYSLGGAENNFQAFSVIGNGNTTYYCCQDSSNFEVGIGTYTASGTTLARTTILQSSHNDNAVSWSSGTKTIFCCYPAEKAVFLNASNDLNTLSSGAVIMTTLNSDTPSTTTSSSDADFILIDDGGTMKKITPANLGIGEGASKGFATAMAIAL